jgi:alpha-tubulin suppressor-like RCC1 family protein
MSNGTVYCWGNNNDGQVGDGTYTERVSPVLVTGF